MRRGEGYILLLVLLPSVVNDNLLNRGRLLGAVTVRFLALEYDLFLFAILILIESPWYMTFEGLVVASIPPNCSYKPGLLNPHIYCTCTPCCSDSHRQFEPNIPNLKLKLYFWITACPEVYIKVIMCTSKIKIMMLL